MAAGAWTFPTAALTQILNGGFDFDTDTFKVALFTNSGNIGASSTTYASATGEVASGNGYTTGGVSISTMEISGTTTVKVTETGTTIEWTASGGSIVARYAVLYKSGGNIVCYCLLDSTPADVTVTDGNTLTVTPHTSGIFDLTTA